MNDEDDEVIRLVLGPKKRVIKRHRAKKAEKPICIFHEKGVKGVQVVESKEGISKKFINSPTKILKVTDN